MLNVTPQRVHQLHWGDRIPRARRRARSRPHLAPKRCRGVGTGHRAAAMSDRAGDGTRYRRPRRAEWRTSPSERSHPALRHASVRDGARTAPTDRELSRSSRQRQTGRSRPRDRPPGRSAPWASADAYRGPGVRPEDGQFPARPADARASNRARRRPRRSTEWRDRPNRQPQSPSAVGGQAEAESLPSPTATIRARFDADHGVESGGTAILAHVPGLPLALVVPRVAAVPTMRPSGLRHAGGASSPLRR